MENKSREPKRMKSVETNENNNKNKDQLEQSKKQKTKKYKYTCSQKGRKKILSALH